MISRGVKTLKCRLPGVDGCLCVGIWEDRCKGFRGDCHERSAVPKGRVVGVILVFVNSSSSVYVKIFMLGSMSFASLSLFWAC